MPQYCTTILCLTKLIRKLQRVQNAAAKLMLGKKKNDHVTPFLKQLHWLPLYQRHVYKILLIVYKTLQGDGPAYLKEMLVPYTCKRDGLRSSDDVTLPRKQNTKSITFADRAFSIAQHEEQFALGYPYMQHSGIVQEKSENSLFKLSFK